MDPAIGQFIPLILIFVIFYFFLIRPQQRKAKDHKKMVEDLKRGDKIITRGGIIGTVERIIDNEKIEVNGNEVSKLDFTSKVLFKEWKLGSEEAELTVMRVTLRGENSNGELEEIVYNLHDEYDESTKTSSMARTTGYTATAAANLFLDGHFF